MKTNLLKSALLLLAVTCSVNMMATDFEIDLRNGQLGTDKTNPTTKYLTIDGETYTYADEAPAEYVAILSAAKYNGTQHGYQDLLVTIPVVAGNYKVTLGTCQYFNGSGSVTNEDGSVTLKSFNQNTGVCYHNNTSSNVIYVTFSVDQDQTIKVDCGNYTPYIKFEQLADIEYIVTFSNNDAEAEGTVPAVTNVVQGENITMPANRTLYKEGYTLTGWNDGENTYAIGAEFTPTADVTLTPVFTENAFDVLTATSDITVLWDFQTKNGAPVVAWEGANAGTGFLVAQAILGNNQVDVKLAVDATSGKFNNKSSDSWCQINSGTLLTFPGKKDAIVEVYTYEDPAISMLDGNTKTGDWSGNKATFNTSNESGTSVFEVMDGRYYRYLKVTYPASSATALEQTDANAKAVKILRNGMLLIEKNGKLYNAQGVEVESRK